MFENVGVKSDIGRQLISRADNSRHETADSPVRRPQPAAKADSVFEPFAYLYTVVHWADWWSRGIGVSLCLKL
jgi:hypothetical protein